MAQYLSDECSKCRLISLLVLSSIISNLWSLHKHRSPVSRALSTRLATSILRSSVWDRAVLRDIEACDSENCDHLTPVVAKITVALERVEIEIEPYVSVPLLKAERDERHKPIGWGVARFLRIFRY